MSRPKREEDNGESVAGADGGWLTARGGRAAVDRYITNDITADSGELANWTIG